MALVWAVASISKPYMPLSSFSVDFIVFNYGIATYLAQFHIFLHDVLNTREEFVCLSWDIKLMMN